MQLHDVIRLSSGAAALLIVAFLALAGRRRNAGWSSVVLSSVQIALTTLLVVCAGLLARSKVQLQSIDPGLSGDGSDRVVIALRKDRYGTPEQRRALFGQVVAQLNHLPGFRMNDPGASLPLAGNAYSAVFFSVRGQSLAPPDLETQQFVVWQADVDTESLGVEVKRVIKSLDRGIHYWNVGFVSHVGRLTLIAFGVYGGVALLILWFSFRGEILGSSIAKIAAGISLGLSVSSVVTILLTGYLFGVSVTDPVTFVVSSVLVAGVAVLARRLKSRPARPVASHSCARSG
jgi:hypothetical protein